MSERDAILIDDAVAVFKEAVTEIGVQNALAHRIPCSQISILADIAANQFRAALWKKRLREDA